MFLRTFSLIAALFLAGCASDSKHYYMLTADGPAPSGSGQGIGVGPVSLAEYIDRPNLVIQEDTNQLGVSESHRWAGDLSTSIARVTATNLGRRLHTGNVRVYPWQTDSEVRYQVTIDVRQLHSGSDGYAVIEAGWRAYALPERRLIASHTFVDREALSGDGYQALVAAQSTLISRMSADIAGKLK